MSGTGGLVEYVHVPDVFVSGVANIEYVGGCARIVFYSRTKTYDGSTSGSTELVITARLVVPVGYALDIAKAISAFHERGGADVYRHASTRLDVN